MTNESAILGLLAEKQIEIYALRAENAQLRADLARVEDAIQEMRTHAPQGTDQHSG